MWLVEARGRVDAELESQMAVTSESALMPKGTLDDDAHGGQATGVCSARLLLSSNSLKHDDIRILMGRSVRAHFSTQNECDNLRLALQSALTQSRVALDANARITRELDALTAELQLLRTELSNEKQARADADAAASASVLELQVPLSCVPHSPLPFCYTVAVLLCRPSLGAC